VCVYGAYVSVHVCACMVHVYMCMYVHVVSCMYGCACECVGVGESTCLLFFLVCVLFITGNCFVGGSRFPGQDT